MVSVATSDEGVGGLSVIDSDFIDLDFFDSVGLKVVMTSRRCGVLYGRDSRKS